MLIKSLAQNANAAANYARNGANVLKKNNYFVCDFVNFISIESNLIWIEKSKN